MRILSVLGFAAAVGACERIPESARLDRMAAELHTRTTLDCGPPHAVDPREPFAGRLHRLCGSTPYPVRPGIDTVIIVYEDSLGHALSVTRVWASEHRAADYARLRRQLVGEYGDPTRCADESATERWRDNELAIAIDSMNPGGIRLSFMLGLDSPICAATP